MLGKVLGGSGGYTQYDVRKKCCNLLYIFLIITINEISKMSYIFISKIIYGLIYDFNDIYFLKFGLNRNFFVDYRITKEVPVKDYHFKIKGLLEAIKSKTCEKLKC